MAREKVGDADAERVDEADQPTAEESSAEPAATRKGPATKPPGKKAPAKKAPAKKAPAKKSSAKAPAKDAEKSSPAESGPAESGPAESSPAESSPAESSPAESGPAESSPAKKPAGKKARPAEQSATARQATEARAAMQRHHRRIEFWRAAAVGAEAAGAAGTVVAGLLAWEWTDRLWGRTDQFGLVVQVAIAVVVLTLVAAWLLRDDRWRTALRSLTLLAAALVAGLGIGAVWTADAGARGPGGVVAAVAAVLVMVGSVGWLIGLRRLRKLFAFGVGYARSGGYGNLTAVRRAQLLGAPAGAVGVAVVVTGSLLVAPGLVSTEDTTTADPLVLSGDPPVGVMPIWEIELDAGQGNTTVRAAAGGLAVDEVHGIRMLDPSNGESRWHWRDEAYNRVATTLAEEGRTIVLGLEYDGELEGRDRLVAIDATTGELRWDRFDDQLVAAMATLGVAPEDGSWLAVPDSVQASPQAEVDPTAPDSLLGVRLLDLATGETQWREPGTAGCTLASIGAGSADAVVIVERCPPPEGSQAGTETCEVAGLSVENGSRAWSWPGGDERIDTEQEYVSECRANSLSDLVFLTYQVTAFDFDPGAPVEQTPALALDPRTGEQIWAVEREEDSYAHLGVDGLTDLREVAGGRMVGVEWPSGQPGVGAAALIIRDVADGSRLGEVSLPEGQPVGVRAAGDQMVMLTHYLPESDQIQLLEVDLTTLEVVAETLAASGSETRQFRSAGLAVGPGAVAVDTLIVPGAEAGPEDARLVVHGFGPR